MLVAQININAQFTKKAKKKNEIDKSKSQKGKRSQISQMGRDQIQVSQLSKQRYFDTERPYLLQGKNKVQIARRSDVADSAIVIPQHSIKEQSLAHQRKSVQIDERQPSLDEDRNDGDGSSEGTEMNLKSKEYEAKFLVDLRQAEMRTQTDYRMTKRQDTNRENLDGFVDQLKKHN